MAPSNENLARSLKALKSLQNTGARVFESKALSRTHRERLLHNGFLQPVVKGWVAASDPYARPGDSTAWYGCFWEFCGRYCKARFGESWVLTPVQSLLIHAENKVIPLQVLVQASSGSNNNLGLPFGTSLFDVKTKEMPSGPDVESQGGLRIYSVAMALVKVQARFFVEHPTDATIALSMVGDSSDLLRPLLAGGHSLIAGRLAGAMRKTGRPGLADEIVNAMRSAGFVVRESDPFDPSESVSQFRARQALIVIRLRGLWAKNRDIVLSVMPESPGRPVDAAGYLRAVEEVFVTDAYNSLSIEGYAVSNALIERVRTGAWNPEQNPADQASRDVLAARGYWQAFQLVKESVARVLEGQDPGTEADESHRAWYRALCQPCVTAGLLDAMLLAGYRNDAVYLREARYTPPRWEAVRDAMPELFRLLTHEPEPAVRAVLGHWLFGYIHPYPDGNGRIARFLMNIMLASGGYPWTVIPVGERETYLAALDAASVDGNIRPFADLIAKHIDNTSSDP